GEFAFIILSTAMNSGVVDTATAQTVLVAGTLSMFAIPGLAALGARIGMGGAREARLPEAPATEPEGAAVLVVGYGRVGQLVGEMLDRHNIPWVGAERDARSIEPARRAGRRIYFGDASRSEFLKRCGLES